MLSKAERYRFKAAECSKHAEVIYDPLAKQLYEDLARHWLELADASEGTNFLSSLKLRFGVHRQRRRRPLSRVNW